jgi:hypothetical protein
MVLGVWCQQCVRVYLHLPLQGDGPVPRGGAGWGGGYSALHSPACTPQAPSAAHHALPVSGQSSAVHVSLCRCVSCALCENLHAPNRLCRTCPLHPGARTWPGSIPRTERATHFRRGNPRGRLAEEAVVEAEAGELGVLNRVSCAREARR